jgi:hypothetical protein
MYFFVIQRLPCWKQYVIQRLPCWMQYSYLSSKGYLVGYNICHPKATLLDAIFVIQRLPCWMQYSYLSSKSYLVGCNTRIWKGYLVGRNTRICHPKATLLDVILVFVIQKLPCWMQYSYLSSKGYLVGCNTCICHPKGTLLDTLFVIQRLPCWMQCLTQTVFTCLSSREPLVHNVCFLGFVTPE